MHHRSLQRKPPSTARNLIQLLNGHNLEIRENMNLTACLKLQNIEYGCSFQTYVKAIGIELSFSATWMIRMHFLYPL